jgi:peroxiredoxin
MQSILNNIKDSNQGKLNDDSKINLSNASNISNAANTRSITGNNAHSDSVVGVTSNNQSLVVGQGSTVSNININPSQTPAGISSTTTTYLKRTREFYTTSGKK